jgi:ABC-type uncharacterized transport system fused permease/ATPase subunit
MKKLVAFLVFILIVEATITGIIPQARGHLFDILESKGDGVWIAIGFYFSTYFFLEFFQSIKQYFMTKTSLWFRTDRTEKITSILKQKVSNSPQRIQEDIKLSYHSRFTVWGEYLVSALIVIQLMVLNIDQPILILASLLYAALSVGIAFFFNPRLSKAEQIVQEEEATFRGRLAKKLTDVTYLPTANKAEMFAARVRLEYQLFTKLQLAFMSILPYVVLVPLLMNGTITLGTLVKHQATFALIVVNAAILIHYYTLLIKGTASEKRVKDLEVKVND